MIESFAGMRALVMGLGRFGGGVGVTRFLAREGARVLVTDQSDAASLADSIAQIQTLIDCGNVELKLGPHDEADFRSVDLVIANPAVKQPWNDPFLNAARGAGTPITTEIRLVVERLDRRNVVGITGSAGKSTTAAMVHHMLNALGHHAHLGGNFGGSLLSRIGRAIGPDDIIVLELSSAMLYWLGEGVGSVGDPGWSPHVAVLTNVLPNHIDWHGTFEHYRDSKMQIAKHQDRGDVFVRGDQLSVPTDTRLMSVRGHHNAQNAATAIAAASAMVPIDHSAAMDALATFKGLPHRLQLVAEFDGCSFYNDSKSTTPQATCLAVQAFEDAARVHLIVGGSDKGADLSSIAALAPTLAGFYTIGDTGATIASMVRSDPSIPVAECGTLESAVERAIDRMQAGDALLLSPGCASFDQYANFEARGDHFCRLVKRAMFAHH